MCAEEFGSKNPFGFTDQEKWHLDEIIMKEWGAKTENEKKQVELDCYKQFKWMGFKETYVDYLRGNGCEELANEMQHFVSVYHKVPHEHEKRFAA